MLIVIKGIHKVKVPLADGTLKTYFYAWRGGPQMKSKPGTKEFAAEHARHEDATRAKTTATLETLIEHFTGTENNRNTDFLALAQTTQADHLYAFKLVKKEFPALPVKLTQQKGMKSDIRKWHRSFAKNPRKADKILFSLSKVFSYAIENEYDGIEKNPCTGIGRLYKGSRRESVWSAEQVETFRKGAHPHLLLPFEVAYQTGQRQGDILAMTWKDYDGTYLQFRQSKGGKKLKVLVHARLKAMLDVLSQDTLKILLNSRKRPWTKDGFKTSWGKECIRLKIRDVTFHDLRGTFITERASEGSSIEDISKISGHSTSEIKSVLEKHYLAHDQASSDAVILRMEKGNSK